MVVRKNFEKDLQVLKDKLSHMGALAESALKDAIDALKNQDLELADKVIHGDEKINKIEEEIEDLVVKIIASQQPVASDLRKVMSAIKITTSVERMGDFAVDIAKASNRIGTEPLIKPLQDIPNMADIVQRMIKDSLKAYAEENVELAEETAAMDDQVDKMYAMVVTELMQKMVENPDKLQQVMLLAFVARYIERIADHATNISEAIIYSVKGKRVDLNQ